MPKKGIVTVRGRVHALNFSPKGDVEGLLVEGEHGCVQVNLPKESHALREYAVGAAVALQVEREEHHGTHDVYRLSEHAATASGVVARLNFARHGEVNGFVLEGGPFVHLKPEGARRYDVQVGEHVTVSGLRREGRATVVIEADALKRERRKSA